MNLIDIIKIDYGLNAKQAKDYLKTINDKQKDEIKKGFVQNAKQVFYND